MADRKEASIERRKSLYAKNKEWRVEIIQLYHDVLVAEYRGR